MEELYQSTNQKTDFLRSRGYTVVTLWEHAYIEMLANDVGFREFVVGNTDIVDGIDPRDAFFGGRTNAIKLHHVVENDERIKYIDICSLYPFVNKHCSYPIGHPIIVTENFKAISDYYGIVKCVVLPPRELFLPVLPYRSPDSKLTFPLCRTCCDTMQQHERCRHADEERCITGTWVTVELMAAIRRGYRIVRVNEVWHWEERETGLFAQYIDKFLKIKVEANGWPENVKTDADKSRFVKAYKDREGVEIECEKVCFNPGLRAVSKLCLNSMWGRLGIKPNKTQTKFVSEPFELNDMLLSDDVEVSDVIILNEELLKVQFKNTREFVTPDSKSNVVLAAFTTAHARLKLYSYIEPLDSRVLYMDTDSVIYIAKPGMYDPPTGIFLGDMTDELEGDYGVGSYITEFVSGGAKNYAYKVKSTKYNTEKTVCKVKGICLNFRNSQLINFDSMRDIVVSGRNNDDDPITVINPSAIQRDTKNYIVRSAIERKRYRIVYTKRAFLDNHRTLPYGY
ncbi:uncharacterized protein LOC141907771 [Tubulanus polymorphus]|uniref:uncharacterized protein LOC141907771 n=1 Tax=Tubulanus polymorphus TaxID=672921 RepID=UPI003DA6ABE6